MHFGNGIIQSRKIEERDSEVREKGREEEEKRKIRNHQVVLTVSQNGHGGRAEGGRRG